MLIHPSNTSKILLEEQLNSSGGVVCGSSFKFETS